MLRNQNLKNSYRPPSRKTVSNNLVPSLFLQTKTRVQQKLNLPSAVCLTTDRWTSLNNISYLAVITAHCLLQNADSLVINSSILTCTDFPEKHTADNILTCLFDVVKNWGIVKKISATVTDNTANMVAAVRLCKWRHIPCFAHSSNLIIQKGFMHIKHIVSKVKAVMQHFKQRAYAT